MSDYPTTTQETPHVAIPEKLTLSLLLRQPNCPFVLYVGNKKLVKREAFERFIADKFII